MWMSSLYFYLCGQNHNLCDISFQSFDVHVDNHDFAIDHILEATVWIPAQTSIFRLFFYRATDIIQTHLWKCGPFSSYSLFLSLVVTLSSCLLSPALKNLCARLLRLFLLINVFVIFLLVKCIALTPRVINEVAKFADAHPYLEQSLRSEEETLTPHQRHLEQVKALETNWEGPGLIGMRWQSLISTMT